LEQSVTNEYRSDQYPPPWSAPPELCGATPRQVKWKSGGKACLIYAIVLGVLSIFVGLGIYGHAYQDARLRQEGRQTDGVVTALSKRTSRGTDYYMVQYEARVDGKKLSGESRIPGRIWRQLKTGSPLPVKYVPSDLDDHRAAASTDLEVSYWVSPAAMSLIGLFAVGMYMPLRKEKRLLTAGIPVFGVITQCAKTRPGINLLKWEFQLPDGSIVKGNATRHFTLSASREVCVLYDPDHPRRNMLYPGLYVEVVPGS
jgi:hypothetical protein